MQWLQINQWWQRSCTAYGWEACQSLPERAGHVAIMRAFIKAPQISSPSARITRYSLYETRSFRHWTSHCSGSRPLSAWPTRRLLTACSACSSWSTDSLPLSGDSPFRSEWYKKHISRQRVWQESCDLADCLGHAQTEPARLPRQFNPSSHRPRPGRPSPECQTGFWG